MKPADLEKLRLQPGYDDIRRGWIFREQRGGQKGRPSLGRSALLAPHGSDRRIPGRRDQPV